MRLDKFLKLSGLCKRRTVAKEMCDRGRVHINGRPAKSGAEVKQGDLLILDFGTREIEVVVNEVPATAVARADRESMVRVIRQVYKP